MQNKSAIFPHSTKISETISSWVFALLGILSLWPFFSWKWPVIPVALIILTYCTYAFSLLFLYRKNISISGIFVFMVLFFIFIIFTLSPGGRPPWFNYYSFFRCSYCCCQLISCLMWLRNSGSYLQFP